MLDDHRNWRRSDVRVRPPEPETLADNVASTITFGLCLVVIYLAWWLA
jgi:hypothetical protein